PSRHRRPVELRGTVMPGHDPSGPGNRGSRGSPSLVAPEGAARRTPAGELTGAGAWSPVLLPVFDVFPTLRACRRRPAPRPPADLREVLIGTFYMFRSGCQWRFLPHGFPSWSTVHTWFGRWLRNDQLQVSLLRRRQAYPNRPRTPKLSRARVDGSGMGAG